MKDKFIQYFLKFSPLTEKEQEQITKDMNISQFKKGHILLEEGQRAFDNYFVLEGCVCQYTLKDGHEHITNFYAEENWILPAIGEEGTVSTFFLKCIEPTTLVVANDKEGGEMLENNPKFQKISLTILEQEIIKQQNHYTNFQNSTPEERYLNLQNTQPGLIQRVPQYLLSSYLGVKPESLSRIRKRIADKRNS